MATMRMLRPAGYLANRAAGRWAFDVLLALVAWATAVAWASAPPYQNATHHPLGAGRIVVLALFIAVYTVAALRPRRAALVCAGLLEIAAVVLGVLFLGRAWWSSATFGTG